MLSMHLLVLLLAIVHIMALPVEQADGLASIQPEQQPDDITDEAKTRTTRGLGFGWFGEPFAAYPSMF